MEAILPDHQLELIPLFPRYASAKEAKESPPVIRRCTPRMLARYPYIRINPPNLAFWVVHDIDRPGAAIAWEIANLPPPAWAAANPINAHAHLGWALTVPVLTGDGARDAPLRYLAAVEAGMRAKLGADPAFSASSAHAKNPFWSGWRVLWGPARTWTLGELAEYVDLPRHTPRRGIKVENLGYGRNCTLFHRLSQWAYRAIRRFWATERNYVLWAAAVREKAHEMNGDFAYVGGSWYSLSGPLGEREVFHVAKHVSLWVWRKFSPERFSEIQRKRRMRGDIEAWARNILQNGQ